MSFQKLWIDDHGPASITKLIKITLDRKNVRNYIYPLTHVTSISSAFYMEHIIINIVKRRFYQHERIKQIVKLHPI